MLLNQELNISFPEGFHVLNDEERRGLRFIENGPGVCVSDPQRHILVSISWRTIGGFAALLLNTGDAAMKMESNISEAMKSYGYQLGGFIDKELDGLRAVGFRYDYQSQDIDMTAEAYLLKKGKVFYYFYVYARTEGKDDSLSVWETILNSIRWS